MAQWKLGAVVVLAGGLNFVLCFASRSLYLLQTKQGALPWSYSHPCIPQMYQIYLLNRGNWCPGGNGEKKRHIKLLVHPNFSYIWKENREFYCQICGNVFLTYAYLVSVTPYSVFVRVLVSCDSASWNVEWREINQQAATKPIFIIKLLSQHVSGIIMPIIRRTRPCITAYGVVHWLCWLWLCAAGS